MTTTARSAPTLEVTAAPDVMDLHSDSGLDFGDGDIDLDLRSTGPHDDVSLHDAGTDLGLDVQTASADQDDFMADHEDLIEDDLVIYDDAAVDETNQQSMNASGSEQQTPVNVEEDLIDYSDDEEEPIVNDQGSTSNSAEVQADSNAPVESDYAERTVVDEHDETVDAAAEESPAHEKEHDINQQDANDDGRKVRPRKPDWYAQPPSVDYDDSQAQRYFDEAMGQQPEHELYAAVEATSHVDRPNEGSQGGDAHHQEVYLHQVTVNYNDVELWLFKRHDLDDSGDYLLDDDSPTNKPMSSLLDVCRTALGSDVSNDMELGLRLDSFNNIELWQEHSSCAFLTLEHLVSLYLQLHTQDGTTDPESFYMTLLFRPRVSALISELQKAAADGIGHSGLRGAIDAGQTSFSAHLSHDSTEHHDDWENEERQQEGESHGTSGLGAEGEFDCEYHEEQNEKDSEDVAKEHDEHHEEPYEENDTEKAPQPPVQSPNNTAPVSRTGSTSNASAEGANRTSTHDENEGHVLQTLTYRSPSNTQPSPHEEDLLDYSDEEDAEATHVDLAQVPQPPSSSSTVQGDDKSYGQDSAQDPANNNDFAEDGEEAPYGYQESGATETFAQGGAFDFENGFDDQAYGEEYNEGNQQVDEEKFADAQELEGYPTEYASQANDENTNHYDDFGDQPVDQPVDFASVQSGDDGNNAAESSGVDDNFAGIDSFLDFDAADTAVDVSTHDQVGGTAEEDFIDFDDDADGEDGEAPVAASAAADPVVSSSSGLQNLSPSGQKRKIDEAGNDGGEATDTTDAKRPRV